MCSFLDSTPPISARFLVKSKALNIKTGRPWRGPRVWPLLPSNLGLPNRIMGFTYFRCLDSGG